MPVLKTVVEPETKTRFRSMAKARGLSESELLRAVVLAVTGQDTDTNTPLEPYAEKVDIDRMTVRMARFLLEATKERARSKGMAPSRYVAALVQSNLTKQPVMTEEEIKVLLASNRELAAIGRNINQISHALNSANSAFHETERVRLDKLAELHQALVENRAAIRALVRASQNAWQAD
ncbi:MobC family plasmid mobilization relaxosome protein [Xylella fastidiosa subsp. multiplex]|uniref:MobC family plasmid mobilization relaxosome protein n=1 Tax=Xylella fastidiosa subsp. multiplex TaxID=644357 RepID=A0AAW6I0M1_XYLFS|nr:plasmid mobilization relaxosome protein MobC [Xylella fastidiosa]MDC6409537.1 MobC family plasmid mobilization relaxosome protein [Xylella fastidiosa subsp. multiplex]MDD0936789.1 MobC family plasmid mobilization relaxosome protein [Xylella fastidiosa subsp. multiplex]MSS68090.1 plasmid mobilization relaxosome protein MobC [Xylella fastidiosa subsp. multiplex]